MHHIHFGEFSLLEKYLNDECSTDETRIFMSACTHASELSDSS